MAKTITALDIIYANHCSRYSEADIRRIVGGRRLTLADIDELQIPTMDKLWLLLEPWATEVWWHNARDAVFDCAAMALDDCQDQDFWYLVEHSEGSADIAYEAALNYCFWCEGGDE